MKNKTILSILAFSLLLIGGCAYIAEICSQFLPEEFCRITTCVFGEAGLENLLNNQEVLNFFQAHPDAEITITLISKQNILKNYNSLRNELGTSLQIKDYLKLELKDGNDVLIAFVDANSKELDYIKVGTIKESKTKPQPRVKPVANPVSKPRPPFDAQCNTDYDCADVISYSCNTWGNPVKVRTLYKCENNKCKLASIHKNTLDVCRDNEHCVEGNRNCLPIIIEADVEEIEDNVNIEVVGEPIIVNVKTPSDYPLHNNTITLR